MTRDEEAIDGLAAQEAESLAACIARGQTPESYADIVAKLRGHCAKLPLKRQMFWSEQCKTIGVDLFPQPKAEKAPKK